MRRSARRPTGSRRAWTARSGPRAATGDSGSARAGAGNMTASTAASGGAHRDGRLTDRGHGPIVATVDTRVSAPSAGPSHHRPAPAPRDPPDRPAEPCRAGVASDLSRPARNHARPAERHSHTCQSARRPRAGPVPRSRWPPGQRPTAADGAAWLTPACTVPPTAAPASLTWTPRPGTPTARFAASAGISPDRGVARDSPPSGVPAPALVPRCAIRGRPSWTRRG